MKLEDERRNGMWHTWIPGTVITWSTHQRIKGHPVLAPWLLEEARLSEERRAAERETP